MKERPNTQFCISVVKHWASLESTTGWLKVWLSTKVPAWNPPMRDCGHVSYEEAFLESSSEGLEVWLNIRASF